MSERRPGFFVNFFVWVNFFLGKSVFSLFDGIIKISIFLRFFLKFIDIFI